MDKKKIGLSVGLIILGGLVVWSGFNNKGIFATSRDIVQGNRPEPGAPQSFGLSVAGVNTGGSGDSGSSVGTGPVATSGEAKRNMAIGRALAMPYGWASGPNWKALQELWTRESGWETGATNPSSGAYGIPQSLPGSKMASAGADWRTNPRTQIKWGLGYIKVRYGSPQNAWAHEEANGWY